MNAEQYIANLKSKQLELQQQVESSMLEELIMQWHNLNNEIYNLHYKTNEEVDEDSEYESKQSINQAIAYLSSKKKEYVEIPLTYEEEIEEVRYYLQQSRQKKDEKNTSLLFEVYRLMHCRQVIEEFINYLGGNVKA